jgi:predicted nucleic acid-binding protein
MKIFIDTSAFYALLDRDDENHQKAKTAWTEILDGEYRLVTSNYILVETFALLQSRIGMDAVRDLQTNITPVLRIEFVNSELHRLGIAALISDGRRKLSLVDCVSFEIMRHLGITSALAFDPHYEEQGFAVLP